MRGKLLIAAGVLTLSAWIGVLRTYEVETPGPGLDYLVDEGRGTCLYDVASSWAFGPIFPNEREAKLFVGWLDAQLAPRRDVLDARQLTPAELRGYWEHYLESFRE